MQKKVRTFEERRAPDDTLLSESLSWQVEKWKAEGSWYVLNEWCGGYLEGDTRVTVLTVGYAELEDFHRLGVRPDGGLGRARDALHRELYLDIQQQYFRNAAFGTVPDAALFLRESPLASFYAKGAYSLVAPAGAWSLSDSMFRTVVADEVFGRTEDPEGLVEDVRRVLKPGGVLLILEKTFVTPGEGVLRHYTSGGLRVLCRRFSSCRTREVGTWRSAGIVLSAGGSWPPMMESAARGALSRAGMGWPMYIWAMAMK